MNKIAKKILKIKIKKNKKRKEERIKFTFKVQLFLQ